MSPIQISKIHFQINYFQFTNFHFFINNLYFFLAREKINSDNKIFCLFVQKKGSQSNLLGLTLSRFGIMRMQDCSYCCHFVAMRKKCLKIGLSWGKYGWDMKPRQCMMVISLVPLIKLCLHLGFSFLLLLVTFWVGFCFVWN